MNNIASRINVCTDDWTAERAIVASNGYELIQFENMKAPNSVIVQFLVITVVKRYSIPQ